MGCARRQGRLAVGHGRLKPGIPLDAARAELEVLFYGVLAYPVTRRTGEIAIRTSLGAMPREIARIILADGLRPAAVGAAAGLMASYAVTRWIGGFLFGVAPVDLPTYGVATVCLLGVAALACYLPARRATRVDPITALREE